MISFTIVLNKQMKKFLFIVLLLLPIICLFSILVQNKFLSRSKSNKSISLPLVGHDSNKQSNKLKDETSLNANLPCDDGPYIWDKSLYQEGIGSAFHWRKWSFIAQGILQGKWIGNLWNGHEVNVYARYYSQISEYKKKILKETTEYFGLSYKECNVDSLTKLETQSERSHHFIYTRQENCVKDNIFNECLNKVHVTPKTIVVFDWTVKERNYYLSAFNNVFRKRFHDQLTHRGKAKKPPKELWVAVHFRWGDLENKTIWKDPSDPNLPTQRSGLGLGDFCICVEKILESRPDAKIFFFAEGAEKHIKNYPILKKVTVFTKSDTWRNDLDIMSQSNLLIGGESSFLRLGAFLCKNCTVIHSSTMFQVSEYEKNHLTNYNYINPISCIKWLTQEEYKSRIDPKKFGKPGHAYWQAISYDEKGNKVFTSYEGELACYLEHINRYLSLFSSSYS